MRDLSLHLLDIIQNSISAKASLIETVIIANKEADTLEISIRDNGCGIPEEILARVEDPFVTTRTTREVGLGISLFKLAAESCGGSFGISSKINDGTFLSASFIISNIDRKPIGDLGDTFSMLISSNIHIDFTLSVSNAKDTFILDTREIVESLGEKSMLSTFEVSNWIREYAKENILEVLGNILMEFDEN